MGAIKVHEFTSVDASVGAPMWTMPFPWTEEQTADTAALTAGASALLLGRSTYEMFGPAWSQRTAEDDPGAPFFNDSHKYVVSGTLTEPSWGPATVLPYDRDGIAALKDEVDGDLYVSGSATLVRALLADGLVDELHLFVYPVLVGSGPYLAHEGGPQTTLALLSSTAYPNGVLHVVYGPALPTAEGTQAD
ncbi:dihydrofolate reductase family protein [Microlunatus spumicola]|uniref:Dihydrofolate reductase family protein n=1 Tax=Microlunatus spumicola TaxID=81499 RepID=A0ABP6WUH1_9ACTN